MRIVSFRFYYLIRFWGKIVKEKLLNKQKAHRAQDNFSFFIIDFLFFINKHAFTNLNI